MLHPQKIYKNKSTKELCHVLIGGAKKREGKHIQTHQSTHDTFVLWISFCKSFVNVTLLLKKLDEQHCYSTNATVPAHTKLLFRPL